MSLLRDHDHFLIKDQHELELLLQRIIQERDTPSGDHKKILSEREKKQNHEPTSAPGLIPDNQWKINFI